MQAPGRPPARLIVAHQAAVDPEMPPKMRTTSLSWERSSVRAVTCQRPWRRGWRQAATFHAWRPGALTMRSSNILSAAIRWKISTQRGAASGARS